MSADGWKKGPPTTTNRPVLVVEVGRPDFAALCIWDKHLLCWRLKWSPGGGELIEPANWPEYYLWHELPTLPRGDS